MVKRETIEEVIWQRGILEREGHGSLRTARSQTKAHQLLQIIEHPFEKWIDETFIVPEGNCPWKENEYKHGIVQADIQPVSTESSERAVSNERVY